MSDELYINNKEVSTITYNDFTIYQQYEEHDQATFPYTAYYSGSTAYPDTVNVALKNNMQLQIINNSTNTTGNNRVYITIIDEDDDTKSTIAVGSYRGRCGVDYSTTFFDYNSISATFVGDTNLLYNLKRTTECYFYDGKLYITCTKDSSTTNTHDPPLEFDISSYSTPVISSFYSYSTKSNFNIIY